MLSWLLIPLLGAPVQAQEFFDDPSDEALLEEEAIAGEALVFVAPFQPRNPEAAGLAAMMGAFLESQLDRHPDLAVISLDDAPPVHDMAADVYLDSCPAGQGVGCAFVVADGTGASFALTGTVLSQTEGTEVEVVIIDVGASREALSFAVNLGVGEDERFAAGVAAVLVSVVRGEAGRVEDIRQMDEDAAPDYSAAAAQLAQLTREIGDVTTLQVRKSTRINRPRLTSQEIAEKMQTEGVKPWERLEMRPQEYLQYRNSGLDLMSWRKRHSGRTLQLILRPGIGMIRGPVSARYEGLYAKGLTEAGTFATEEVYAWQSQINGTGILAGVQAGIGIAPAIEIGMQFGYATGEYTLIVTSRHKQINKAAPSKEHDYANANMSVGPYLLAGLMPTKNIRPVVGLGALLWTGSNSSTKETLPSDLPVFASPQLWLVEARVGAEMRLTKTVDMYLHVPLNAVVAGDDFRVHHSGKNCVVDETGEPCLDTSSKPPGVSPMGAGVMVGFQVRMLGKRFEGRKSIREYDLDDY